MRRKCFFLLIVVLILLYGLDALDIPLAGSIEMKFFEESKDYTGKVTGIQERQGICLIKMYHLLLNWSIRQDRGILTASIMPDTSKAGELALWPL